MSNHIYVPDPTLSVAHGPPVADEPGLGALTLAGFVREVTAAFGPREALVERLADGRDVRWTYDDLWARSVAVAKGLVALGLGKGERVGVLMTNSPEFLAAMFGTALAGGVGAPLSTFSTPAELDHLLTSAACSVLLFERHVLKKDFAEALLEIEPAFASAGASSAKFPFLRHLVMIGEAAPTGAIETWDDFLARGAAIADREVEARAATVSPADPGVLFFSSGSTNKPKGILSAHRGVALQCWRMRAQQGLDADVRYWTANGFFWSGNFSMVVGGVLSVGGTIVLQRTFQPEEALALMEREKVSFLFAWPHQWAQLVAASNWATTDLSSLRYVDAESPIAGHPTVRSTWIEPRHCYGNTETFTLTAAYPADTTRQQARNSSGVPLGGVSFRIVDPMTGATLPLGERGEIAVKGPTLMLGYVGVPLDETLDDQGYFRTGDGGYLDVDGRLFWEGRLNDIIKTGGANVSPLEIDDVIRTLDGVQVVQTVGVPDDLLGELVVSCIVRQDGAAIDEGAVRDFARQKLASYKVPRRVLFFRQEELTLTGSAKVKTADLRKLTVQRLAGEGA